MPTRVNKADMSMSPLGPPRNALLWLRAKEMAANLGRGASFQTVLQMYQMLSLAPGFGAVSKGSRPRMTLRRAKQAIGKSSAALDAAARINASPDWDAKMQRLTVSAPTAQRPAKLVGSLDEVLGGLPLPPKDAMGLRQGLEAILEGNLDAGQVMRYTHDACEDAGIDQPGIKKEVAQRMAYLAGLSKSHSKRERPALLPCVIIPQTEKRKRLQKGDRFMHTVIAKAGQGAGSRGGHVIGHTPGGLPIYESHDHTGHSQFTRDDHHDAGALHAKLGAISGRDFGNAAKEKNYDEAKNALNSMNHHNAQAGAHFNQAAKSSASEVAERLASPSETEHANRSPGGGKRMATAGESSRLASKTPASSPWDNQKSMKENFDMIKAKSGPGSRGGKVIGTTRSGKPIYASGKSTKGFTASDHISASNAHEKAFDQHMSLAKKLTKDNKPDSAKRHMDMASSHAQMMDMHHHLGTKESGERMSTPSESEHANRAPGGAKRMATASESGRLAMHSAASSPWDNQKSMKENFDMKKAGEMNGINFGEASLSESAAPAQQNVDSVTELSQVIADFEAASVGGLQGVKVIEWALHDDSHPTGVEGVETTPVPVDLSANAPSLPFGQTISLTKGHDQAGVAQPFSPLMSTLQFYASQGR
jgi:hypothetical protein